MKLAELKHIPELSRRAPVQGTEGQDSHIAEPKSFWRRSRSMLANLPGIAAFCGIVIWLVNSWLGSGHVVSAERL